MCTLRFDYLFSEKKLNIPNSKSEESNILHDNILESLDSSSFNTFAEEGYENPDRYSIRVNKSGVNEMFIAGTRDIRDWANNVKERFILDADKITLNKVDFSFRDQDC